MEIVCLCYEMGWDYETYMRQPKWFIDLLRDKLEIDGEEFKKQTKQLK